MVGTSVTTAATIAPTAEDSEGIKRPVAGLAAASVATGARLEAERRGEALGVALERVAGIGYV